MLVIHGVLPVRQSGPAPATMTMPASPTLLLLCAATFILSGYSQIWAAPAPAPALEPLAISANISGSLGNLCSSQAGVITLIQGSATNQDQAGLAVSVPANLANAVAVQQVAQVSIICGLFQCELDDTARLQAQSQSLSTGTFLCLNDVRYC